MCCASTCGTPPDGPAVPGLDPATSVNPAAEARDADRQAIEREHSLDTTRSAATTAQSVRLRTISAPHEHVIDARVSPM